MKAVILAGGLGSRLSEETVLRPKPMVEIGGKPILSHIMNTYSAHGVNEFIIALGYKGEVIKDYFLNYYTFNSNLSIDLSNGQTTIHDGHRPRWKVHLVDTGQTTQTGGRLKRLQDWLTKDETFLFTYGDGVIDLDIESCVKFHRAHGKFGTVTSVHAPSRFGRLAFEGDRVVSFCEKQELAEGWINGGYFVLHREVLNYIDGDDTVWEREPVERLAQEGQLVGYRHKGFWSCMDTLKEKHYLEDLWTSGKAPWKVWP
ncbi:MAG TPA: glucose-1-phosphate cytidylyltransferase [Nitrospiraceae bacterium]|nr:glucose-1-phosphate cytidylyltransferase [Nitrospiraceae bacterium]